MFYVGLVFLLFIKLNTLQQIGWTDLPQGERPAETRRLRGRVSLVRGSDSWAPTAGGRGSRFP